MPKLFKKISSKSNGLSQSSSAPDVPTNDEHDDVSQTVIVTSDGPVPEYSDDLKEAWAAAHQELPQAQGAEKLLNNIGMSIITLKPGSRPRLRRSSMCVFRLALTYN